ncbi:M1 family aminopeptidase [Spirochaeta isovalerica]|uniref:Aminopeptidase N n=1 Tax=Spirochaeta isovalerica TaxID=150 RepID=A0A841R774_9SPIO|nr:M1 family aminopeptidase [Spirochaeta isovalerica]MBB6479231.1 aminopeptidase N [Spirochaeta isovalerica]
MAKLPSFKITCLVSLFILFFFSCSQLREIEQAECALAEIDFTLDNNLETYSGTMKFHGTNDQPAQLESIGFFLLPERTGGNLEISKVSTEQSEPQWKVENSILSIHFTQPIQPGGNYDVQLAFSGSIPRTLKLPGIFFRTDNTVALGHFYPMPIPLDGQGSFAPVEPSSHGDPIESILSRFDVAFQAPSRLRFAASGPVIRESETGDRINCRVSTGPVRDFYLLGSAEWDMVTKVHEGIRISSWYPEGKMQQGIDSLYAMEEALKIFEKHLGPYPYNTLSIVSGPLGPQAGGMEYPGIIVLNDNYYTNEDSHALQIVIAHEIGHQWFYNLVGNDPVMEPWLDESFAQYATWLYFNKLYGERAGNSMITSFQNRWTRVRKAPIPLNLSVHEYEGKEYGAIPYGKGPLFLFTLRSYFGEELFEQFILDYQRTFRWDRMDTEKLRDYMYGYFGEKGDDLFREWVYGET